MNIMDNVNGIIKGLEDNRVIDEAGNFAKEMWFLLHHGQKISAIKKIRGAVGAMEFGLKEAKDFAEELDEKFRAGDVHNYPFAIYTDMARFQEVFAKTLAMHRMSRLERLTIKNDQLARENFSLRDRNELLENEVRQLRALNEQLEAAKTPYQPEAQPDNKPCDCPTCIREREEEAPTLGDILRRATRN